mmetsp:Transcript_10380/g.34111  ORF Transcript_10380/g.34111 Transcript_10380/m.34111 type:complete len:162 (+) Transcript_10380:311-796(+)
MAQPMAAIVPAHRTKKVCMSLAAALQEGARGELGFLATARNGGRYSRMRGNILDQMCRGIDDSTTVVVFVTRRYISKVASADARDNCKLEFNYARQHRAGRMLAVPMEPGTRDPSTWTGAVSMVLGSNLYEAHFDLDDADDAGWDEQLDKLAAFIRRVANA